MVRERKRERMRPLVVEGTDISAAIPEITTWRVETSMVLGMGR